MRLWKGCVIEESGGDNVHSYSPLCDIADHRGCQHMPAISLHCRTLPEGAPRPPVDLSSRRCSGPLGSYERDISVGRSQEVGQNGHLNPPMAIGDHGLNSRQSPFFQVVEEPGPENFVLAIDDRDAEDLALAIVPDARRLEQCLWDVAGTVADGIIRSIEEEIRDGTLDRSRQKILYLTVTVLGNPGDR